MQEKSCGAVIMRRLPDSGGVEVLLIQMKNGGHYSFPKGHTENGESEHETAAREILEETNLRVRFLDGFRAVHTYSPKANVSKDVVYFAAVAEAGCLKTQEAEVICAGWYGEDEAPALVTYENDKKILSDALAFFKTLDNRCEL